MTPIRLLLSCLLFTAACASPEVRDASMPPPAELAAAAPATEPEAAGPGPRQAGPETNRDLHGPEDTSRYISMLASEERIRQLKPELVAAKLVERLGLGKHAVIADIGCGPGIFDWPFAAVVPDGFVLAADVEPAQLDALRAGLLERKIDNVVPVLASYETPHLPPGLCDMIFVADTYHHIEDRVAYFERLKASLTPNGSLVLLEFKDGELPIGPPPAHKVPLATRHSELQQAGYELVESLQTHVWQELEIWRRARVTR